VVGHPEVLHESRALPPSRRPMSHQSSGLSLRRRSIATYEPGWLLATFYISDATAITTRGSVNRRPVDFDSATPIDSVTSAARCLLPRRSGTSM
jgi:hypothetical protein